ncbi:MAG: phage tail terminator family protein [Filifactoraceae bacterium]
MFNAEHLTDAIAYRLGETFNKESKLKIYKGEAKQDLQKPCLLILLVDLNTDIGSMKHVTYNVTVDIAYFNSTEHMEKQYSEPFGILTVILDVLERIVVDGMTLRYYNFSYIPPDDGVSHLVLSWKVPYYKVFKNDRYMDKLERGI